MNFLIGILEPRLISVHGETRLLQVPLTSLVKTELGNLPVGTCHTLGVLTYVTETMNFRRKSKEETYNFFYCHRQTAPIKLLY